MYFNKRIRYKGTSSAGQVSTNVWRKPMPTTRQLVLTEEQRLQLAHLRDASSKSYLRERAAALLKVASGIPAAQVARMGLLRPRQPDTVYRWLNAFQAGGVEGLKVKPGAGRKAAYAFSPSATRSKSSSRRSAVPGQTRPPSTRTRHSEMDTGHHQSNV